MGIDDIIIEKEVKKSLIDNPDIFIDLNTELNIISHAHSDTKKELGGLLLGTIEESEYSLKVTLLAHIPAEFTDNSSASVTFTHGTWKYFEEIHKKNFPDLKIIGWYHTHPSFGIFLSSKDIFIQENFFNLPWQIALVVDPTNGTKGYFTWQNNKCNLSQKINYISDRKNKQSEVNEKLNVNLVKSENKEKIFCVAIGFSYNLTDNENLTMYEAYNSNEMHTEIVGKTDVYLYVVSKDETINDICKKFYGNEEYVPVIAGINNLITNKSLPFGKPIKLLPKSFFECQL